MLEQPTLNLLISKRWVLLYENKILTKRGFISLAKINNCTPCFFTSKQNAMVKAERMIAKGKVKEEDYNKFNAMEVILNVKKAGILQEPQIGTTNGVAKVPEEHPLGH